MNVVKLATRTHFAHGGSGKTLCGRRWSAQADRNAAVDCDRCADIKRRLGT